MKRKRKSQRIINKNKNKIKKDLKISDITQTLPILHRCRSDSISSITSRGDRGMWNIIDEVSEMIVRPIKTWKDMKKFGIRKSTGVIFYGPPGTGKSMSVNEIKKKCMEITGCTTEVVPINCTSILSKWVGNSEKNLEKILSKTYDSVITILFFDEIDSVVPERIDCASSVNYSGILSTFLVQIDNLSQDNIVKEHNGTQIIKRKFIIGATNKLNHIDPAFLRNGRFRKLYEYKLPSPQEQMNILKYHTASWCVDHNTLKKVSNLLNKKKDMNTLAISGAYIKDICDTVGEQILSIASKKTTQTIKIDDIMSILFKDSDFILRIFENATNSSRIAKSKKKSNNLIHKIIDKSSMVALNKITNIFLTADDNSKILISVGLSESPIDRTIEKRSVIKTVSKLSKSLHLNILHLDDVIKKIKKTRNFKHVMKEILIDDDNINEGIIFYIKDFKNDMYDSADVDIDTVNNDIIFHFIKLLMIEVAIKYYGCKTLILVEGFNKLSEWDDFYRDRLKRIISIIGFTAKTKHVVNVNDILTDSLKIEIVSIIQETQTYLNNVIKANFIDDPQFTSNNNIKYGDYKINNDVDPNDKLNDFDSNNNDECDLNKNSQFIIEMMESDAFKSFFTSIKDSNDDGTINSTFTRLMCDYVERTIKMGDEYDPQFLNGLKNCINKSVPGFSVNDNKKRTDINAINLLNINVKKKKLFSYINGLYEKNKYVLKLDKSISAKAIMTADDINSFAEMDKNRFTVSLSNESRNIFEKSKKKISGILLKIEKNIKRITTHIKKNESSKESLIIIGKKIEILRDYITNHLNEYVIPSEAPSRSDKIDNYSTDKCFFFLGCVLEKFLNIKK